jgi:hypothetical protein
MQYIIVLISVLTIFMLTACKSGDSTADALNKLDAASKSELLKEEANDNPQELNIVILLNEEPSPDIIETIKNADVQVITTAGKIISAKALPASIRNILKLDEVISIEINKTKFTN